MHSKLMELSEIDKEKRYMISLANGMNFLVFDTKKQNK